MSPMNHVGRRPRPPIFIPNIFHNQSASRFVALTFLSKNVSNESVFFVQRALPYRAFFRNHIRTNFTVPTASTASTPSGGSTLPVLISKEQSTSKLYSSLERQICLSSGVLSKFWYLQTREFYLSSNTLNPQDFFKDHLSTCTQYRTSDQSTYLPGFSHIRAIHFSSPIS